jgi:hypothetical protein
MNGLSEVMKSFHAKVSGNIAKIEALFVDMAPEPQKGKPMPKGKSYASRVCPNSFVLKCANWTPLVRRNDQCSLARGSH